jgi:hypothetical protein
MAQWRRYLLLERASQGEIHALAIVRAATVDSMALAEVDIKPAEAVGEIAWEVYQMENGGGVKLCRMHHQDVRTGDCAGSHGTGFEHSEA